MWIPVVANAQKLASVVAGSSFLLSRFAFVGLLTFLLDLILWVVMTSLLVSALPARMLSYSIATFFAWRANQKWTFETEGRGFFSYYFGAAVAGVQNILISFLVLHFSLFSQFSGLIGIAIGCVYGLVFNFLIQKNFTFRKPLNK
jgi:putative flippase GtrA